MTAVPALKPGPVQRDQSIPLGMAQLAFRGLSEDWWLRHLGDVHWQLIADAVGQRTTVFRDAEGRQIYAAFCATEFEQLQPDAAQLGGAIALRSDLWAAAKNQLQSNHFLTSGGAEIARFRLISTFVAHQQRGLNASVRRASPSLLPVLPTAPDSFARTARAAAKAQRPGPAVDGPHIELTPCIGTDFNAVGLLYFPSYTRMFEQAERRSAGALGWSPIRRRMISYFGNIDMGERVTVSRAPEGAAALTLWSRASGTGDPRKLAFCAYTRF